MGIEAQVASTIREEAERIPPWAPDINAIRRSARNRTRRRAAVGGVVAALAAGVMVSTDVLDAVPRPYSAPAVDGSEARTPLLSHLGTGADVPPGRYVLGVVGADLRRLWAEVDVPDGFRTMGDADYRDESDTALRNAKGRDAGLSLWTVDGVNADPCHGDPLAAFQEYRDPGPSVDDLATALSVQPYRVGPSPRPVTLAGYDGQYLELRFPAGFRPHSCATGNYEAWNVIDPVSRGRYERYWYGPRTVDRIWVLDVSGTRVVVNAHHDARLAVDRVAALDGMLASLELHTAD